MTSLPLICPKGKLFRVCNPKKCQNEKQNTKPIQAENHWPFVANEGQREFVTQKRKTKYNADTIGKPLAFRCKRRAATKTNPS